METIYNTHENETCVEVISFFEGKDYTTYFGFKVLFGTIYFIIFIAGLIGNLSVIYKIATKRHLQSTRNIFLVSLMLSDIMLCLTAVPVSPVAAIMKRWIFGGVMCALIPLCQTMSVIITSFCLTAIAADKYVHIINLHQEPMSKFVCLSIVFSIWISAFLINIPLVLSFQLLDGAVYQNVPGFKVAFCGHFCDETAWPSESYQRTFGTFIMIIQFIIPMIIITFCYSRILKKVDKDSIIKNRRYSASLSKVQQCLALKRTRKVNYILIMMVVTFVVCWFPITLYNILRDYEKFPSFVQNQPYLCFLIVHSIAMTMIVWNPLLFFWMTKARKKRLRSGLLQGILTSAVLTWNPAVAIARRRSTLSSSEHSPKPFKPLSGIPEVS